MGETMLEIIRAMDEQAEIIMRQADRINRLSALLLQHYEVEQEELKQITETGKEERGSMKE